MTNPIKEFLLLWLTCILITTQKSMCERFKQAFSVYWNVPSHKCQGLNLTYFHILSNINQTFVGDKVVIFYNKPGLYPYYDKNGNAQNNGLPQNSDIEEHLKQLKLDVENYMPKDNFSGVAVIDWEAWVPLLQRNFYSKQQQIYIEKSRKLVHDQHPHWSAAEINKEATWQFNTGARKLMTLTLDACKKIRSNGLWGFYGFPHCYNHKIGEKYCSNETQMDNDLISWMFAHSSAVFPSIYLSNVDPPSSGERAILVSGIIREALRMRDRTSSASKPVFSYSKFTYREDNFLFYSKEDLVGTIIQSLNAGLNGVVLWESSSFFDDRMSCALIENYLESELGPLIKACVDFAEKCSRIVCNSNGICINKNWQILADKAQEMILMNSKINYGMKHVFNEFLKHSVKDVVTQNMKNYTCHCFQNWKGDHCQFNL